MLLTTLVLILVLIVMSRPFLWGKDSAAGKKAAARMLAFAPEPRPEEWSSFARSLVIRDRTVAVGSIVAVLVLALFWAEVPSDWVMVNTQATFMLLAIAVFQPVAATILAVFGASRSIGGTVRESDKSVARLNKVGIFDYVSRATVVFPLALLAVSAAVNIAFVIPGVRERLEGEQVALSLLVFTASALVLIAAFTLASVLVKRGATSQTKFGVFGADLIRLEAVRSLYALSACFAALSFVAASLAMMTPIADLGEDMSALAIVWMGVDVAIYVVLFRMTLLPASLDQMRRLWGAEGEHAQNA